LTCRTKARQSALTDKTTATVFITSQHRQNVGSSEKFYCRCILALHRYFIATPQEIYWIARRNAARLVLRLCVERGSALEKNVKNHFFLRIFPLPRQSVGLKLSQLGRLDQKNQETGKFEPFSKSRMMI
jgi:hypothetical protein